MNPEYPCLQPFYEKILAETISDPVIREEIEFVWGFFEEWTGNLIHPVGKDLPLVLMGVHEYRQITINDGRIEAW